MDLVDAEARAIGEGDVTDAIAETVDRLGVGMVIDGVGAASGALDLAVEYAKERRQFGVPIGTFQAVQHLCADMLRAVELARASAYYAGWACDAAAPGERHRATTMAQAFAADSLYDVGARRDPGVRGRRLHVGARHPSLLQAPAQPAALRGGAIDQLEELAAIVLDSPA